MPRTIFVYEFITGGGLWTIPGEPAPGGSLFREGAAMVAALASDLERIADTQVITLCDSRCDSFQPSADTRRIDSAEAHELAIPRLAQSADVTFIIAPELDGELLRIYDVVAAAGGKIIGPRREVVQWASDKNLTAKRLQAANILVPETNETLRRTYPVVVKRVDGAGSESVQLCESPHTTDAFIAKQDPSLSFRVESFCEGTAVSVALLLGPHGLEILPTCLQHLSNDGSFRYEGGRVLGSAETDSIAERAQHLATRVAKLLHGCTGYLGIDMIIGSEPSDAWVIEINPRLTTSYTGLRACTRDNLAERMLQLAHAKHTMDTKLRFFDSSCDFGADGSISHEHEA